MLFSIPLFVFFPCLCLLTKHIENENNNEEITIANNSEHVSNVETVKISNHQVESTLANSQTSSFKENFKECRKNHASSSKNGGYILDGCCEFLPAGAEGTAEFLKCDACNCHRNFHRKEIVLINVEETYVPVKTPLYPQPTPISTVFETSTGYVHVTGPPKGTITSPALPPFVVHGGDYLSKEDLKENVHVVNPITDGGEGFINSKKRFRTKFTYEQKKKMLDTAAKLGWKIHKQDENIVENFCKEIGVKYQVFKVWMYNNKHTWKKAVG